MFGEGLDIIDWAREEAGLIGVIVVCLAAVGCVFFWKLPSLAREFRLLRKDMADNNDRISKGRAKLRKPAKPKRHRKR